jgi:hypothetical protein
MYVGVLFGIAREAARQSPGWISAAPAPDGLASLARAQCSIDDQSSNTGGESLDRSAND